ncbi:MAG TPA: YihY family inner membrane protein [Burkholderiaceae bacterium]|nr:YihY family inner membrane protein [Burkholderiaceae bacterium]
MPSNRTLAAAVGALRARLAELAATLKRWPWLDTARTLRERFREDHLGLTASSLTFTTLIALVPLVTVTLAVFSAFPMFASFQGALEKYFLQALVPDAIAKPVLGALTQFASKAARMGSLGLVLLLLTALALMLTIDRALNAIWRVREARPFAQRVLVYWGGLTLGPLVLGVSLSLTASVLSFGRGVFGASAGGVALLLNVVEFVLLAGGMATLFHYVPNTHVRWRHAWAGGVFVAAGLEVAKRVLAWYVGQVPTFSAVYGAFASVPIFLLWIYTGWVIVLWGAVIAAYAPSLSMRIVRLGKSPGHRFALALAVLDLLARARRSGAHGLALHTIAARLRIDPLQVEPVVESLVALDWVARVAEADAQRLVLLAEPAMTKLAPLVDALLLEDSAAVQHFRQSARLSTLVLADALDDAATALH